MSWKDVKNAAQNADEAAADTAESGKDIIGNLYQTKYKGKAIWLNPEVFDPKDNPPGIDPGDLPKIDPDDIIPSDSDPHNLPNVPDISEIIPGDSIPGVRMPNDPIPPINMPYFPDIPLPSDPVPPKPIPAKPAPSKPIPSKPVSAKPDCSEVVNEIRGKIAEYFALQAGKDPEYAESLGQAVTAYANAGDKYKDQGLTGQAYEEAMEAAAQKAIQGTDISLIDFYGFNYRAKMCTDEITNEDESETYPIGSPGKTIPGIMDDSSSLDGTKGAAESLKEMVGKSIGSGVSGAINNIVRELPDDFISDSAPEDNGLGV